MAARLDRDTAAVDDHAGGVEKRPARRSPTGATTVPFAMARTRDGSGVPVRIVLPEETSGTFPSRFPSAQSPSRQHLGIDRTYLSISPRSGLSWALPREKRTMGRGRRWSAARSPWHSWREGTPRTGTATRGGAARRTSPGDDRERRRGCNPAMAARRSHPDNLPWDNNTDTTSRPGHQDSFVH